MVIKYFSWIKEHIGKSEELIELPDNVKNISELINYLNNFTRKKHRFNIDEFQRFIKDDIYSISGKKPIIQLIEVK